MSQEMQRVQSRMGDVNLRASAQMREYRAIAARIARDRPSSILDWGCGHGQMSDLLLRDGLRVTSYEYRPEVPEGTRPLELYPHIEARFGSDSRRLPFDDDSFEAALSCGVLEHVEDPDASLDELARVLVPGGTLYVYKLPNRRSYLEAIARRLGWYYHGLFEFDRLYDPASARALLERHGYAVCELRSANILPLTLTGGVADRVGGPLWTANRMLVALPWLGRWATNIELVARLAG